MAQAFRHLHSDRPVTMGGSGSIPWSSIDRYARRHRVRDFRRFHLLIVAMDAAWLQVQRELNAPTGKRT